MSIYVIDIYFEYIFEIFYTKKSFIGLFLD